MTLIPAKSAKKLQKSTVKTAKKPILREKCSLIGQKTETRGGVENFKGKNVATRLTPERARELSFKATEIKKVRAENFKGKNVATRLTPERARELSFKATETRGGAENFKGKNVATRLTPERARELSFKATEIKKVRAAARARLLDIALHKGQLENLFQAGLDGDTEAMAIAEKAAKMVGLDYQASHEASQKIELAGKLDNNLNVKIESVK